MGPHQLALKALCWKLGIPYVGARGPVGAPVCIIGEAAGETEEQQGLAFVGSSGQEQDRMVQEAGLITNDVWFTNPFKVRPPDNELSRIGERGIPDKFYLDAFFEELEETKPTIIVPVGATSLGLLCPQTLERIKPSKRNPNPRPEAKISKWKGSLLVSPKLNWPHYVIPNWHPAFILREWSERQVAVLAYERANEEFEFYKTHGKLQPLPEREIIADPPADTVIGYLRYLIHEYKGPISSDIEMIRGRSRVKLTWAASRKMPYTIALADSPSRGMSFCFWHYDIDKLVIIWRLLDEILRSRTQIGQNYRGFDCVWLEFLGFRPNVRLVSDTLVRHHVLWPELEHKLQFQTFQYTREPYYKDEGKEWSAGKNIKPLMVYNTKDACCTREVYDRQEEEFADRAHLIPFCKDYEERLASAFHYIEKRGLRVHPEKLEKLRQYILRELDIACGSIKNIVKKEVVSNASEAKTKGYKQGSKTIVPHFNVGSPEQVKDELKACGLKIPYDRHSGGQSTGEDNLNRLYAETNHELPKNILRTRELNKIRGTYVEAKLLDHVLLTTFHVTGTLGGRRSSSTTPFGFGSNLQNQPHHSDLGRELRACYEPRVGKIFMKVDQVSAEDWPVQAIIADLSGDTRSLDELRNRKIDRHANLGSFLFGKPLSECGKDEFGNDTPERFFGKKTRHAGQYDMGGDEMAKQMAKENHIVPPAVCWHLLEKFHAAEPAIRGVYHKWVQDELTRCRTLITPLGRERIFFGLHPWRDNIRIFKAAYSYVPQSTVGDNTGLAILYIEENRPDLQAIILDEHDGILLEIDDNVAAIQDAARLLDKAFDRVLRFPNGLEIKIPIDISIGFDLIHQKKVDQSCLESYPNPGLEHILNGLRNRQKAPASIISGVPPPSSAPVLKGVVL